MEEISDNKWLANRVTKALNYLKENNFPSYEILNQHIEKYFIPILKGSLPQDQEDIYFDNVDSFLDDLEADYPEMFK